MKFEELSQKEMVRALEVIQCVCDHYDICEDECPYYSVACDECIFCVGDNPEYISLRDDNEVWRAVN